MFKQYGEVDYWNIRYTDEREPFEWYMGYGGVRHFLTAKYLVSSINADASDKSQVTSKPIKRPFQSTEDCRVLIAGCGSSQVGESMLCNGFGKITNVDFSSIVIEKMKEKYSEEWYDEEFTHLRSERILGEVETSSIHIGMKPHVRSPTKKVEIPTMEKMQFECMDLTKKMNFKDASFDLIFCKGTLDAVLCSANTAEKVQCMMNECHRILDHIHGVMIIISYGEPENRLNIFDRKLWEVKPYTVPKPYIPGEKTGR
jgi:SAM-dependent methyltransferase